MEWALKQDMNEKLLCGPFDDCMQYGMGIEVGYRRWQRKIDRVDSKDGWNVRQI